MSNKSFSVIIPVYNGADTLAECLNAVVNQNYPKNHVEILLVNDGSTDNTLEIAQKFPIKIINLPENKGRVVARKIGAESATYERLVFNDARVIPEPDLLKKIVDRDYLPLMPDVIDYDGSMVGYSRLFYLLRKKIYYPYYPLFVQGNPTEIYIDAENFDRMPKGTTNLVCTKSLWLTCQPEDSSKYVNDDTKILRCIVKHQPLLRTATIQVRYLQRTNMTSVLKHMYGRGPRFADYYLTRGGKYRNWYKLIQITIALMLVLFFLMPVIPAWGTLIAICMFVGLAVWLSERPLDIAIMLLFFPPVIFAFGLGIIQGQFARRKTFTN